jgi:hypothetical protein
MPDSIPAPPPTITVAQPTFYSADDALKPPPSVEWCVQGLLTLSSLNLLVGAPGAKKTFLAMDLAVCVALGKPWLGRFATSNQSPVGASPLSTSGGESLSRASRHSGDEGGPGVRGFNSSPVLFVDEESGLNRIWARLNAALRGHQAGAGVPLHFVSLAGFDLRQPQDAETLTQHALSFGARLIVIDTLSGIMRGGDENSIVSVSPLIYHLRRLAETCKAAVLVVHHNNRTGSFRGSSSIAAGADLMLGIQSAPSEPIIKLTALKSRHETPPPFCARANFETSAEGDPLFHLTATDEQPESERVTLGIVPLAILQRIQMLGQSSTIDLMHNVEEGAPASIRQAVHELFVAGYINRTDGGSRGKLARFVLTEKGREYLENQDA